MNRPKKIARLGALVLSTSLVLAACGGGSDDEEPAGTESSAPSGESSAPAGAGMQLYFVDGNTANYSEDFDPGTLEGVKATYPGAELGDDFKNRMLTVDPKLKDFTYGPESYDATVVAALAAVAAKADSGKAIGSKMQEVSAEGEKCTTFKECADLLADGADIDYDGVSGPIDLNSTGSPSAATIGIFQYGADNSYSPIDYVTGEIPDVASVKADQKISGDIPKGDGTLTVGTLLPQSGDLAFLGPPEFAGVDLAVKDINEAGGVNGKPVKQIKADSGDGTPNIAPSEADKLLRGGADVVVGAASSSVSLSVIDRITAAGVAQVSPANTSTAFDTYADNGLYFRTAPSDVLQGQVMASTLIGDGKQNVAILARQDSYGEALADNVKKFFEQAGGTVVSFQLYDPNAATFSAEVQKIASEDPDAIVLIAFDETKKIVPELIKAGLGQGD
ncbi:ABC transporter substrate-binding protein [Nocardioides sp.]|uniref:ABC transporter substrate-binding protein n=1 Tax=Nocardioides sp. TaxID=35761 RepID=UPI002621843B|nr:ABC transporter substrate-binding protein [Nocardioides sp.]MDI6908835.1 ABC transporter substrate-binding protein [Nocardioides sp.]